MRILGWNYRSLGNSSTVSLCLKIVQAQRPSIIFLMETKQKEGKGKYWTHRWSFENFEEVGRVGMSRGLLSCWTNIHLVVLDASKNIIHTRIKMPNVGFVYCTFIYGHPTTHKRKHVWNHLLSLRSTVIGP